MKKLNFFLIFCILTMTKSMYGQDPSFAQYYSSPLNINPALAGNINSAWRLISNVRSQWFDPSSPNVTGTISFDKRHINSQNNYKPISENVFGIGGMLMYDQAMDGALKSNYASLNLSYNIKLSSESYSVHKLGIGFGTTYGRKTIDVNRLTFQDQFTGNGFNISLPTGESALSNMKGYISASTGLIYSMTSENTNFDMGISAFHVNKPVQTFFNDQHQYLAMRKVIHSNFETYLNDNLILGINGIYQFQNEAKYTSVGAILGVSLPGESNVMLNAGGWYWHQNALVPYIGVAVKAFQFGLTYDINTTRINQALLRPNTFEISLIVRGKKEEVGVMSYPGIMSYPWK